nr:gluconolactonase [Raoultella sp. NCTC 9187]
MTKRAIAPQARSLAATVYRFDEARNRVAIAISDTQRPNGLAFSPDDKWLYVADMSVIDFPSQGRREIRAYRLEGDSALFSHVVTQVKPGIPDGFCVDRDGNIYCSCETGILIFSAAGELLETIAVPERVSNCTFGGPDGNTLFITATTSLYRVTLAPSRLQG